MTYHPYLYELARHTMRETEHRAAERRLVAALRPSRRFRYQQLLARVARWRRAVGAPRPAVGTTTTRTVGISIRPTAG